jgi:hypothetical protein
LIARHVLSVHINASRAGSTKRKAASMGSGIENGLIEDNSKNNEGTGFQKM